MKTSDSIALCIPAFKAEKYLPKLLESALNQTIPFAEIIVCVDACPEKTAEVARQFPVKVIVNERNSGCSASKNNALAEVRSEWVHFHDADDILYENFVEDACEVIARKNVDVIAMGFEYVDEFSKEKIWSSCYDVHTLEQDPVRYCIVQKIPNFAVYRTLKLREVGGFDLDPAILYNEDVAFHLKLAIAGLRFTASNTFTSVNFRQHGSMSQANQLKCSIAHYEVMRRAAESVGEKYGAEIAIKLWAVAGHLVMHNDLQTARKAISLAQRLDPRLVLGQSGSLRVLARVLGPFWAYRIRELLIRLTKPQFRQNVS